MTDPAGGTDGEELRLELAAWLSTTVGAPARVDPCTRPAAGMSNDTFVTSADWGDGARAIVLRLAPAGRGLFPRYELGAQVQVLRALASTDVPVPRVLWWEPDAEPLGRPFFVMERVRGRIPPDGHLFGGWVMDLTTTDQRQLVAGAIDVLARIHRIDLAAVDLEILDRGEHGPGPLDQELGYWRAYLDWASDGDRLARLDDAYGALVDTRPADDRVARRLAWGDARLGNLVVDNRLEPVAVLDWEMAVLGPPELDLGWYLFLERTARQFAPLLPGFPDRDALVSEYERAAGRPVRDLAWYEAWSGFRTACIQVRMAEAPEHRERNPVTKALRVVLEEL